MQSRRLPDIPCVADIAEHGEGEFVGPEREVSQRSVPCSSFRRYSNAAVAPSCSDTESGAATTEPSARVADPPTWSRLMQPLQIAARFVSGMETYRLPSYSAATRSETKLRQRCASTVAPIEPSRCSDDTTWPVLSIPVSDQS